MSVGAWILLVSTWSVVIGVSGYLFWKVLTRPRIDPGGEGEDEPGRGGGPAG